MKTVARPIFDGDLDHPVWLQRNAVIRICLHLLPPDGPDPLLQIDLGPRGVAKVLSDPTAVRSRVSTPALRPACPPLRAAYTMKPGSRRQGMAARCLTW